MKKKVVLAVIELIAAYAADMVKLHQPNHMNIKTADIGSFIKFTQIVDNMAFLKGLVEGGTLPTKE